jgi:hypothetical protein
VTLTETKLLEQTAALLGVSLAQLVKAGVVFRRLEDRSIRYIPLILKLFPDPATRPRQREVLIEFYRKGKVDESVPSKRYIWRLFIKSLIILRPENLLSPRIKFHAYLVFDICQRIGGQCPDELLTGTTPCVAMPFISGMPGFCLSRRFH